MDISPVLAFLHTKNKFDVIRYQLGIKNAVILQIYGLQFEIKGVELAYTLSLLYHIFEGKRYKNLNIKGKRVIDVGGYIGDSAIYFADRGARKVYSIEAYPELVRLIKDNAKLNKLKLEVINAVISPKKYETISKKVQISGKLRRGRHKIKGIKITDLPRADLLKINLNYYADLYIRKQMPLLKEKYAQIYWNEHLKNTNRVVIWKRPNLI